MAVGAGGAADAGGDGIDFDTILDELIHMSTRALNRMLALAATRGRLYSVAAHASAPTVLGDAPKVEIEGWRQKGAKG